MKLVFHSSTLTMMHGPINIRFRYSFHKDLEIKLLNSEADDCICTVHVVRSLNFNTNTCTTLTSQVKIYSKTIKLPEDGRRPKHVGVFIMFFNKF